MDLGQILDIHVATSQQGLEAQTWDSCILEGVENGRFHHNEQETVLEINGKKANPSISASLAMHLYASAPPETP